MAPTDLLVLAALGLVFAGWILRGLWREYVAPEDLPEDPVERAREQYARGDISREEFDRRLELHLDPATDRIRTTAEQVHRLGPETSLSVAQHFDSYEAFVHADREAYEAVPGVGPNLATGLVTVTQSLVPERDVADLEDVERESNA